MRKRKYMAGSGLNPSTPVYGLKIRTAPRRTTSKVVIDKGRLGRLRNGFSIVLITKMTSV